MEDYRHRAITLLRRLVLAVYLHCNTCALWATCDYYIDEEHLVELQMCGHEYVMLRLCE